MKSLLIISVLCLFLTGCQACRFLDWNCSEPNPKWSKNVNECTRTQQAVARTILGSQYTDKVDSAILSSCIKNTNYKFKTTN